MRIPSLVVPGLRWLVLSVVALLAVESRAQRWYLGASPHFEVLSGSSERETRRLLVELERFRENVLGVFPIGEAREPKVRVYLFPSRKAFRPYMPIYEGKPKEVGGYFVGADDEAVIALLPEREASEFEEPLETVYHEYFHLLTHARGMHLPLWLEEGLAELFSTLRIDSKYAEVGEPKAWYALALSETGMLRTAELIAVDRSSPHYNEDLRGSLFYAQAWAFTHYLFCGTDAGNLEKLAHYIAQLREPGIDADASFRRIFGNDLGQYDFALRQYLDGGRYRTRRMPARSIDEKTVAVRPASDFERDVALANLRYRVHGESAVAEHVQALQVLQPDSPRPFEVLGAIAIQEGRPAEARAHYQSAIERGSDNPFVYVTMARDRMRTLDLADFDQRLAPVDAFDLQRWLDRALALEPDYADALELLAEVESRAPSFRPHAVNLVQSSVSSLPRKDRILLALGVIRMRAGDAVTAGQIAEAILQSSETNLEVKHAARMLRYRLAGAPETEAPPPAPANGLRARTLRETSDTLKRGETGIGTAPTFGEELFEGNPFRPAP